MTAPPTPRQVLLAGATGFIGGSIARRWAALGLGRMGEARVRGMARNVGSAQSAALRAEGIEMLAADLARPETLPAAARGCDLVIHAAGAPDQAGTVRDLYAAARQAGARRFIYISSMEIYADNPADIDEKRALDFSGYRAVDGHISAERALLESAGSGGPDLTILRFGAVYGPRAFRWTLRPLQRARRGRLSVPGAGDFPWLYLYVENMIDGVTAAATAPTTGVYNIFDGMSTYAEFMRAYAAMTGQRLRHSPLPVARLRLWLRTLIERVLRLPPDLTTDALRSARQVTPAEPYRAEKARRDLGWQPRISLEEGMEIIQRSNGFHGAGARPANPWKENDDWKDK